MQEAIITEFLFFSILRIIGGSGTDSEDYGPSIGRPENIGKLSF
jgi:hypothetical protein